MKRLAIILATWLGLAGSAFAQIPVGILNYDPAANTKLIYPFYADGSGDSDTNPNYHVYRWNSLDTINLSGTEWQVGSFWDENENLVIGVRSASPGSIATAAWTLYVYDGVAETPEISRTEFDNHNDCNIGLDSDGYLHIAYDHHATALKYRRSTTAISSFSGTLTSTLSMVGTNESDVSYPTFFRDPQNILYFIFRNGISGNGDLYFYKYTTSGQTWAAAAGTSTGGLLIEGTTGTTQSPYWTGPPQFTPNWDGAGTGYMWLGWVWRASGATWNHDVSVVRWNGTTFTKTSGAQTVPITLANCEIIDAAPATDELTSFNSMVLDSDGYPHFAYAKNDSASLAHRRLWHTYWNGSAWSTPDAVSPLTTTANFSFASAPNIFIDGDDVVRIAVVSPTTTTVGVNVFRSTNASWTTWAIDNLTTEDVSVAEGTGTDVSTSHDRYQWATHGVFMTLVPLAGDVSGVCESFPESWSAEVEATITNPGSSVTDPFFVIDGSLLPAAFWDAVQSDLSDVRLSNDNGQIPCVVFSYNYGSEQCWIIGRWLGPLSNSGTQKVSVHAGNATANTLAVDDYFGQQNSWRRALFGFWPTGGGNDLTRFANNLTMNNATAGDSSSLFTSLASTNFNGTNGNAQVAYGTPYTHSGEALVCWANADAVTASMTILSIADTGTTNRYCQLALRGDLAGDPIYAEARDSATAAAASIGANTTAATWYHLAAVLTSTTSRNAVVDGVVATTETSTRAPTSLDTFSIGALVRTTTGSYFDGKVCMVQHWRTAPSTAEMTWQAAMANQSTFWGTWADANASGVVPQIIISQLDKRRSRQQSHFNTYGVYALAP